MAHERTIPVETQSPKVGELGLLYPRAYTRAVEILDANEEARPGRTGEQPGQEGGAEVAELKRAGVGGAKRPSAVQDSPCGALRGALTSLYETHQRRGERPGPLALDAVEINELHR